MVESLYGEAIGIRVVADEVLESDELEIVFVSHFFVGEVGGLVCFIIYIHTRR